jgi:predicted enzyme related to lactoylglutathione lyase
MLAPRAWPLGAFALNRSSTYSMSVQIKEFAFVFHPVTDVARARNFYEQLLGLKIGLQIEFAPGQWWIEYDIAGQALAISNAMPGAPASSLTLEVVDLDAALAAIRSAGVALACDVMEFPPCRMFAIKDPDGNQIGLHQKKAET